ncbi:MAG: GH92 family glycosyl hydrolase [Sphingobacteriaceae bacterium]|nr:GH92 family glycosyl hydrolase [Sphingobacteriaceae bacterium]
MLTRILTLYIFFTCSISVIAQKNLTPFVNPFIGTGGHGHTFPGAVLPFGMVQLSPDTRVDGSWDGCSGYHYSDSIIYGFSHTHLSGTGCSDWGDVMLMPVSSNPIIDPHFYSSTFNHKQEKASAGYYQVFLKEEKVNVELTATLRTGIHKYSFPDRKAYVILDLLHRDKLLDGNIQQKDSNTISGFRSSEAWAKNQKCFFALQFSKPIKSITYSKTNNIINGASIEFEIPNQNLLVKVGISNVSEAGAMANLLQEADHWDFEKYKLKAESVWNEQLNKIQILENNSDRQTIFYTALYHCFIHPSLASDVDGSYRDRDDKIYKSDKHQQYTVFSLWDTYRALHPLFTIIERERTKDFLNTFLNQYKTANRLPVWELSANETECMIGYHSVSVIADAVLKGIDGIDNEKLFDAMKAASQYTGFGIQDYGNKNFLDVDDISESVSRTLEYAYDDWCIAQMAKKLNKQTDFLIYMNRAQAYKNMFDPKTGFMRPRKNGNWLFPFDAKEVNNHFTEGNSWQYSFYVPQDIEGLIAMHGGKKKFETKLDSLFQTSSKTSGRTQADITGLIGQYAHGNEPSHHMAYLYNYIGKPEKTQKLIAQIRNDFYKNTPDGLIGNEDCGQMSAWYVFSALGFYPVCPGSTEYIIGSPLFDLAEIRLENNIIFAINKYAYNGESGVVQSVKYNDGLSFNSWISHNRILNGGSMTFSFEPTLSAENKFGRADATIPNSKIETPFLIPTPIIQAPGKSFIGKTTVKLQGHSCINQKIVYTLDGTEPDSNSSVYLKPLVIEKSGVVKCKTFCNDLSSATNKAEFVKRPNNYSIRLKTAYNKQYTAGGADGVIDGIYGSENWRKGEWQGYQYKDFDCVIDLKKTIPVHHVSANFLQDSRSWILFPKQLEISISSDGKTFKKLESLSSDVDPKKEEIIIKKLKKSFEKSIQTRYIRIKAINFGELPEWHLGHGDGAFIFVDEIEIN